jgi:hypothetical protein
MALNGAGTRFVSSHDCGDLLAVTTEVQAATSYPALGEPVATLLGLAVIAEHIKQVRGVVPINAIVGNSNLGHDWSFDPAQGTMGTLRNWTAISATPTEHAAGAYGGTEDTAVFRVTFFFPKFRSVSL